MVTEVISRLSNNDIVNYKEYLQEMLETLPDILAKKQLKKKLS
jgi:hypothetical protein